MEITTALRDAIWDARDDLARIEWDQAKDLGPDGRDNGRLTVPVTSIDAGTCYAGTLQVTYDDSDGVVDQYVGDWAIASPDYTDPSGMLFDTTLAAVEAGVVDLVDWKRVAGFLKAYARAYVPVGGDRIVGALPKFRPLRAFFSPAPPSVRDTAVAVYSEGHLRAVSLVLTCADHGLPDGPDKLFVRSTLRMDRRAARALSDALIEAIREL